MTVEERIRQVLINQKKVEKEVDELLDLLNWTPSSINKCPLITKLRVLETLPEQTLQHYITLISEYKPCQDHNTL